MRKFDEFIIGWDLYHRGFAMMGWNFILSVLLAHNHRQCLQPLVFDRCWVNPTTCDSLNSPGISRPNRWIDETTRKVCWRCSISIEGRSKRLDSNFDAIN